MTDHYYCDIEDLKKTGLTLPLIIQLSNDSKAEVVNEENFNGCRKTAAALIDSYCLKRYAGKIPFQPPVPEMVIDIAVALTKYFLYRRKNGTTDKELEKLYDNQIKLLDRISNGTLDLGLGGQKVSEDSIMFTALEPTDRVSHVDNMKGYFL